MQWRQFVSAGIVAIVAASGLAAPALAQVEDAAKAKLQASADAIKKLKTLRYDVVHKGEGGMFATFAPVITAKIAMERAGGQGPAGWKTRSEGKAEMTALASQPPFTFLVVSDGQRTTWADDRVKTVYDRLNPSASGELVDLSRQAIVPELAAAEPFAKELAAATLKLEPQAEIAGVLCDVIFADPGENQPKMRWSIGPDGLPRKGETLFKSGGLNDSRVVLISNVVADQPLPEGTFAISTPEGYAVNRQEDAAPAATPTPRPAASADGTAPAQAPAATPGERAVGANVGDLAPDFELAQPDGTKVKLSSLRGQVVVVDFWGTWCIPCRKASPILQEVYDSYKEKGVRLLALSVREKDDKAPADYMAENKYTYTLLLKGDDVAKQYRVKLYPTYFVIGRDGAITAQLGFTPADFKQKLTAELDKALAAGATPAVEQPRGGVSRDSQ